MNVDDHLRVTESVIALVAQAGCQMDLSIDKFGELGIHRELKVRMRTTELVKKAYEAVAQRDMDTLLKIFSADCEFVDVTEPEAWRGREAFKTYMASTWEAFPDFHPENPTFTAQGNVVAAELELVGTHRGEFLGVAPTGATVRWRAAAFYTVDPNADEITREVYYYDAQSLRAALASD